MAKISLWNLWLDRIRRNIREISFHTLAAGVAIFLVSYGGLFIAIRAYPQFFVDYINPMFNSDGSRDLYFYVHPLVLSLSLSVFWNRFSRLFEGGILAVGIEFGILYTFVALVPVLWITYSAMDVNMSMILSWLLYGLVQTITAGMVFGLLRKQKMADQ
jgi:hypothetical protein